jgi:hypothetical protein
LQPDDTRATAAGAASLSMCLLRTWCKGFLSNGCTEVFSVEMTKRLEELQ